MPYNTKNILRDAKGQPIPQEFDQVADAFIPLLKTEYYGNSTDAKPSNVTKGSTFIELDTKAVFVFDGSSWVVFS